MKEPADDEDDSREAAKAWDANLQTHTTQRWVDLTDGEIRAAIFDASPLKAPGDDGITNLALKQFYSVIEPYVRAIFIKCIELGHHPSRWKHQLGVVLRKPNKPSYRVPKAYRIIALLPTLGKALESVMARRLAYYGDQGALPRESMGGRPGRSCEEAIVGMLDHVQHRWRQGDRVLMFSTDLSSAFPMAAADAIIATLRRRGVPPEAIPWIESFLSDRSVTLIVDGVKDGKRTIRLGLPQGSPLSPILFLFYNADLVEALRAPWSRVVAWIDDVPPMVYAKSTAQLTRRANILAKRAAGWAAHVGAVFEGAKGEATIFEPVNKTDDLDGEAPEPIMLQGQAIPYVDQPTYLGYKLDKRLNPKAHVTYCARRAAQAMAAVGKLTSSRFGIRAGAMRRLYEACIVPRMLYASAAWYSVGRCKGHMKHLEAVQRVAAAKITGGWKSSGLAALEVAADLLPIELRLQRRSFDFAMRLCSADEDHPIFAQIKRARRRVTKRHPSQLARLLHAFPLLRDEQVERIRTLPLAPWEMHDRPTVLKAASREDSIKAHDKQLLDPNRRCHLHVYTDGSRLESGHTGASWVVRRYAGKKLYRTEDGGSIPLGTLRTVYEAEVFAIGKGFQLLSSSPLIDESVTQVHFWVDNQAALDHAVLPHRCPAQEFAIASRRAYLDFRRRHYAVQVVMHWIAGHEDVEGNELADQAAKEAAERGEKAAAADEAAARIEAEEAEAVEEDEEDLEDRQDAIDAPLADQSIDLALDEDDAFDFAFDSGEELGQALTEESGHDLRGRDQSASPPKVL